MNKRIIKKECWKPGNMIYPLPAVMVSCGDAAGSNIVTVAWTGTICTNPPMTYISLRPSRYSYDIIKESGYFVLNLTTEELAYVTDYCGVKSGRDHDKFEEMKLTKLLDEETNTVMIGESPVNVVCRVTEIKPLGSHHMFIAEVLRVYVSEAYLDEKGKFQLNHTGLMAYSHGTYLSLGRELGSFGYSVSKKVKAENKLETNRKKALAAQNSTKTSESQKLGKGKSSKMKKTAFKKAGPKGKLKKQEKGFKVRKKQQTGN